MARWAFWRASEIARISGQRGFRAPETAFVHYGAASAIHEHAKGEMLQKSSGHHRSRLLKPTPDLRDCWQSDGLPDQEADAWQGAHRTNPSRSRWGF